MSAIPNLQATLLDALGQNGPSRTSRMFGGIALHHGEQVFGIVFEDALYLRVNEVTRKAYERAGMKPLQIPGIQSPSSRYMQVPPAVIDNAASLRAWARQAIATSVVDSAGAKRAAARKNS